MRTQLIKQFLTESTLLSLLSLLLLAPLSLFFDLAGALRGGRLCVVSFLTLMIHHFLKYLIDFTL